MLLAIEKLERGTVIARPSIQCKSPYVADILLENGETVIAHAPSLGCCGYVDKEQFVLVSKHQHPKTCTHVVQLAHRYEKGQEYFIGVHPKMAEKIVHACLENGYIDGLQNITNIKSEQCFLNSRFDFVCNDNDNKQVIIEVKSVPCGDYEDIESKERRKRDYSNRNVHSKIAYFPDGYRKKKVDTVSPRALKHIQELETLKLERNVRTILIFVVQRPDCVSFQGSNVDPIYKSALNKAHDSGVEIIPIQVEWQENGMCHYKRVLPFLK